MKFGDTDKTDFSHSVFCQVLLLPRVRRCFWIAHGEHRGDRSFRDRAVGRSGILLCRSVIAIGVAAADRDRFTRFGERILPERGSPFTRCLDPAALETPIAG